MFHRSMVTSMNLRYDFRIFIISILISTVASAQFIPFANWKAATPLGCEMPATSYTACSLTTTTYDQTTISGWTKTNGDSACQAAFGAGYCWSKDGNLGTTATRILHWNAANSLGASAQVCSAFGAGNMYTGWGMNTDRSAVSIINIGPVTGQDDGWYSGSAPHPNSCFDGAATYNRFSAANLICCK